MQDQVKRIVERFGLRPHPEGGYFSEVYRSELQLRHPGIPAGREPARTGGTLIYYLLAEGQFSAFHRVRWTDEIWHLYAGGPMELHVIDDRGRHRQTVLTTDLGAGTAPTALVRAGHWQAARPAPGAHWAFGGCTVSPGFEFDDFEMPARRTLLEAYPEHAEIIGELTRVER